MFTPILGILPLKMVEADSYFCGTCFLNRTFLSRWWFQICFFNVHPDPWGNDPIWRAFFWGMGWNQPPVRNALKMAINRHLHPRSLKQGPEISPYFLWGGGYLWCKVGPKQTLLSLCTDFIWYFQVPLPRQRWIGEQWKKPWLVGLYRGWHPTQLYRVL